MCFANINIGTRFFNSMKEEHASRGIKLFGIFGINTGVISIIFAIGIIATGFVAEVASELISQILGGDTVGFTGFVLLGLCGLIIAVAEITGASGILHHKEWARTLFIGSAIASLLYVTTSTLILGGLQFGFSGLFYLFKLLYYSAIISFFVKDHVKSFFS